MYTASFIALTLFSVRPKVQLRLLADMCSSQENWPITADSLPIPNTQSVVRQVNSAWHLVRQSLPHSLKLLEMVYGGWMQCVCVSGIPSGVYCGPKWTRTACLLSHRWLRAIKSECVSVVFLLRWEFHSFPRDGQCDFFTWDLWIGRELLWNKLNIFPEQSIFDAVLVSWSAEAWFSYGPRDTGHVEAFLFQ